MITFNKKEMLMLTVQSGAVRFGLSKKLFKFLSFDVSACFDSRKVKITLYKEKQAGSWATMGIGNNGSLKTVIQYLEIDQTSLSDNCMYLNIEEIESSEDKKVIQCGLSCFTRIVKYKSSFVEIKSPIKKKCK